VQDSDTFTYVGIECFYNKLKNRIELGMSKRILKLAAKYNISKPKEYPLPSNVFDWNIPSVPYKDITDYRSLVMSIRYIAQCVKPEALFSVSYLSIKQCNPSQRDFDCAIHILQYLYRTHDECMWLYGIGIGDPIIRVYADASHRSYEDLLCHGSSNDVYLSAVQDAQCSILVIKSVFIVNHQPTRN